MATTTKIVSKTIAPSTFKSNSALKTSAFQAQAKDSIRQDISSVREASKVLSTGKIKPALGSQSQGLRQGGAVVGAVVGGGGVQSSPRDQGLGQGGSTGGLVDTVMDKGLNAGAVSGGNAMANPRGNKGNADPDPVDPEDKDGTGWFGFSQNTKENLAVGAAVAGFVATKLGATPAAVGAGAVALGLTVLATKGTPLPSDDFVTGTSPGLNMGRNGVSSDPLTGMGPSRTQTLGQFTGDQIRGSGVPMTREEVSNLNKALGQASGSHEKTPNPITGSDNSGVIDNRSTQHIQFLMTGGGVSGPMMQGGAWQAALASVNQFQAALA